MPCQWFRTWLLFFSGFTDLIGEKDISDIIKSALGDFTSTVGQVKGLTHATIISETWKQLQQLKPCFFLPLFLEQTAALLWTDRQVLYQLWLHCTPLQHPLITRLTGVMCFLANKRGFSKDMDPRLDALTHHRRRPHRTQRKFHEKSWTPYVNWYKENTKKKNARPSKCNYWPNFKQEKNGNNVKTTVSTVWWQIL